MKMPNVHIREEIRKKGVIPFARFMELALYCPETGYYESLKDNVGRGGDFITSVSVGSLFGELLAFQFAAWLAELKIPGQPLTILEAGAHDGKLAADILRWLQGHRPAFFARLEYRILEPSPRRQAWQQQTLQAFAPHVRWFSGFSDPALPSSHGILFSNELLDAFPVHRLGWDAPAQQWFEWGVTLAADAFTWAKLPPTVPHPSATALEAVLPDNYTIEVSPAAEHWWSLAANHLQQGKLLTFDYGFTSAEEIFSPVRTSGTLRAYSNHHVTSDLLTRPGEQDLTAHVNFSAIQTVGETAGLTTEIYSPQARFLTQILARTQIDQSFGEWTPNRSRQFQTLTHPEHLGRAFQVLVQAR